jgi:hypothetical protein
MAYMKDSAGRRLDSFEALGADDAKDAYSPLGAQFAVLTSRLQADNENCVFTAIGDSTGVSGTRWVYLVSQWLKAQYPRYTVNYLVWNGTNYDAAIVLQTGSYTRTFTDGATTNASATLTSAAGAAFVGADVGRPVSGTGIPAGTTIIQWLSATSVTMSANATATGSALSVTLGAHKLSVYNGSTSGMDEVYSSTKIAAQIPVAPNLIIVNYGHNKGTMGDYRAAYYDYMRRLSDWYPRAGLVCTAQNPQRPDMPNATPHLSRAQSIIDLCATEGYGLINITQAFLDTPNWDTTLILGDGIHPTDDLGSPLWASVITTAMKKSIHITPRSAIIKPSRTFIPAAQFIVADGTPTLSAVGAATAPFPAWTMVDAALNSVVCQAEWPNGWQSVNVYVVWSVATGAGYTAGNNSAMWEWAFSPASGLNTNGPFPSPLTTVAPAQPLTYSSNQGGQVSGAPNGGAWETIFTRIKTGLVLSSVPVAIRIRRDGANASDNLAENAYFRGLIIERAS